MLTILLPQGVGACQARAARAKVEAALDAAGWPWSQRLSARLDLLVTIEEDRS